MPPTRRVLLANALATPALACGKLRIADLPLTFVDGYPTIPAALAGQPVTFILDTGAQAMLITPEAAATLTLPLAGLTRIYGTGGSQQARLVRLPGLRLGGAPMPDLTAPVAPLPLDFHTVPPFAGLLGAALLARFDLELDAPAHRVTLWAPDTCEPPGTTLPVEVSRAGEPFLQVRVNGQPLLALIDTGSRATLLDQRAARRLGLSAPISANTARGVDGERQSLEHTTIRLAMGPLHETDTPVSISPLQLEHGDMLLGMDVLARRPFFLAYSRQRLTLGAQPGPSP